MDGAFKVILTDGCHRRDRLERLLGEISGGRLISSRTGWVPNVIDATPNGRLRRSEPGQDTQAGGVPADTCAGSLFVQVPLGLPGSVALADEYPDCLVDY